MRLKSIKALLAKDATILMGEAAVIFNKTIYFYRSITSMFKLQIVIFD